MHTTKTSTTKNQLAKEDMRKTLWFLAKWGGIIFVYLRLLQGGNSFKYSFMAALILTLVVQRNRLTSSYLFAQSGEREEKKFMEISVSEALLGIWMYGMSLYIIFLFVLPMACTMQSWFGGTYLSKNLCSDASDIQFSNSYE